MDLQQNLLTHLNHVARDRDPYFSTEGHFYVQHYIRQQLERWGTVETNEFDFQGKRHQNLVLNLPSNCPTVARPPILIGAHYDAVPGTNGADDNATGVVALLELARLFAATPARFPVRLVAFDLEEFGLLGSQHYARELRQQQQPLRLMLSLEMLGYCDRTPHSQTYPPGLKYFYPNRGDFISFIGNWRTIPDLIRLCDRVHRAGQVRCRWLPAGNRGAIVPATRQSDHAPFWDQGYPAMMVTDTAFMRNPHYHKVSDRVETLDIDFLTGVCRGLADGIQRL
ncbi:M28 family peptidase [Oculatella sp. LEGE 06141]|uniref:M28 family peptidase n=1 Tax=Oculatella sp. LEGE 06141 TaxID=1828648 RepID=UPI0018800226|nr:M28 family peptidase [Oculatella sp. LEGE 06141]MBE9177285.1 M28 family peptidase [Oculatella sp. LEGE 06141]